ncbi:methionine biosynthesis protein MetW [bacterium]|nr:methionine biosynthesis protein MetW [bacterium]
MIRKRLRENILLSDYDSIVSLVEPETRVLDLGCGKGELLLRLIKERGVQGRGVEINQAAVIECIHKGLSVFQGNIDEGLADYGKDTYDYVILNQTLQVLPRPDFVINEMLRVGKKVIVSFPNFGYWKVRTRYFFTGRMPQTIKLPAEWYNTPNIHLLTIKDFKMFCKKKNIQIIKSLCLLSRRSSGSGRIKYGANWLADEGVFVLARGAP